MNMEIDISMTKTLCISLKNASYRRENIQRVLSSCGFSKWEFMDGVENADPVVGCALSHLKALKSNDFSEPLLILEDDVDVTPDYTNSISIPEDTDAVYLGYSWWAWDSERAKMSTLEKKTGFTSLENWNKGKWYKIHNMTSAHAVLYLTKKYADSVVAEIEQYLNDTSGNKHCDVAMARIQDKHIVLAPEKHHYFQVCPRNTFWTNRSIA
jgi:GR25 family glycosyltransferase involved in LPS biosynthesis